MAVGGRRRFRFGVLGKGATPGAWLALARKAEDLGFDVLSVPDHFTQQVSPLPALASAAAVTTRLRLATIVLATSLRHPAALAKEAATVDALSNGRLELGLGTGWMRSDFQMPGVPQGSAAERLARLAETITICKTFFSQASVTFRGRYFTIDQLDSSPAAIQQPHPPILIGGRRRRALTLAAREADIVSISRVPPGPGDPPAASFAENMEWIRAAAGQRYSAIEIHVNAHAEVADNLETAMTTMARRLQIAPEATLQAPGILVGSPGAIVDQIWAWRERFDVSYFTFDESVIDAIAPVVSKAAGM
jgi:probable F420-dependent oxidoreductase